MGPIQEISKWFDSKRRDDPVFDQWAIIGFSTSRTVEEGQIKLTLDVKVRDPFGGHYVIGTDLDPVAPSAESVEEAKADVEGMVSSWTD